MSTLYAATDKRDGQPVVLEIGNRLKLTSPLDNARFFYRATVIVSFEHEGIRNPKEFGVTEEQHPFFVWQKKDELDLWDVLDSSLTLSDAEIASIFRHVCDALGLACAAGVLHSTLYPSDLVFEKLGAPPRVGGFERILMDTDKLNVIDFFAHYKAPELCIGNDPTERSQIYGIGCLLYEAVTTKPYEMPSTFKSLVSCHELSIWEVQLESLPLKPIERMRKNDPFSERVALLNIVEKCLQLNPLNRYKDLAELKAELLCIGSE